MQMSSTRFAAVMRGLAVPVVLALLASGTGHSRLGNVITAVVWDLSGTPTALPPLAGDTKGVASAINACGEAAGRSSLGGITTAVVWR